MKSYALWLPYWKQGSDLSSAKEHTESDSEAFRLHAETLRAAASMLDKCAKYADEGLLKIEDADTHHIGIVPKDDEVGDRLVKEELLNVDKWKDEEEWNEEDLPEYDPEDDPDLM